jgi:hypothetical protein
MGARSPDTLSIQARSRRAADAGLVQFHLSAGVVPRRDGAVEQCGVGRQCHPALEALAGANIAARRRLGKHSKTLRALARSVAQRLVSTDLFFASN